MVGEQKKKYQREWVAARRKEWFDKNGPCVLCGCPEKLELDHVDPSLKVTHKVFSLSESRRNEELSKCQVLCSTCHKKKTKTYMVAFFKATRPKTTIHGTNTEYRHGCRCDLCRKAKYLETVQYRKKIKL